MNKKVLAGALAFLLLALCGCGGERAVPDKTGGGESKGTDAPETVTSEPPERSDTTAGGKSEGRVQAALTPALEDMLAEAPEGCVMAIVRRPDAPRFAALGEPALTMDASEYYPGLICETVLIVPLADGIDIDVARFERHTVIDWEISNELLYHIEGKMGEVYALNTCLAETMPTMSVTARIGGRESVWSCTMDGSGDIEAEYVGPPSPPAEVVFSYEQYITPLSGAMATCRALFGDEGFWETVAYGIARTETAEAFTATGEGLKITLSRDRFFSYVETFFPGQTAWPPWEGSGVESLFAYNQADDTYEVAYFDMAETADWSLWAFRKDADTKGGRVTIVVRTPGIPPYSLALEVVWREKRLRAENDPIAFEIIELRDVERSAEDETELYMLLMDSEAWAGELGPAITVDGYRIVDLDGDGVAEFLLEASGDNGAMSALYAIEAWETKELLRGELFGGSPGGGRVIIARDGQSGRTVVGTAWYADGFDGAVHQYDYYSYAAGGITPLASFGRTEFFDDKTPDAYEVDGSPATQEEYARLEARFEPLPLVE